MFSNIKSVHFLLLSYNCLDTRKCYSDLTKIYLVVYFNNPMNNTTLSYENTFPMSNRYRLYSCR